MSFPVTLVLLLVAVARAGADSRQLAQLFSCPADPLPAADLHECPEADLGPELLADVQLTTLGTGAGDWGTHIDEGITGDVSISFEDPGAEIEVPAYSDPQAYKVLLHQTVADVPGNADYELCMRSGSDAAENVVRFAVDGGDAGNFEVPGGLERELLTLQDGNLTVGCFRFSLTEAVQTFAARVALEFGNVVGGATVCQVSLRRCSAPVPQPQEPQVACPAIAAPLSDAWRCPAEDMGPELLTHHDFPAGTLRNDAWGYHKWEADGATFEVGAPGAQVFVRNHSAAQPYEVQLYHDVDLNAEGVATYELCVQAVANESGSSIRFAVDSGNPSFEVPGALDRTVMRLQQGSLSAGCFRFVLNQNQTFNGRVDLEFGSAAGQVSVCQASLRRCNRAPTQSLTALRHCFTAPLQPGAGCTLNSTLQGNEFELNSFGQETSGKTVCLERLRAAGFNTFVYTVGQCELWQCPSRAALLASSTSQADRGGEVFSELCDYEEPVAGVNGADARSPVFVKLWEWNFADVARECEDYLGPNGFDAVQVAPVMEHITGPEWFTKYQPVSFRLDSRSGTIDDLRDMVKRCRAAGVSVIVDVVLNHIGKPCDDVREAGPTATPCRGFAYSAFGNRRLAALKGWPDVGPEHFHHLPDDTLRNCAVDPVTFQCPNSDPPNDCTMCDFYGLPDWNTGLENVQQLLSKHLKELHDMGVTMLRLDAASYVHVDELSRIINQMPWDYVFQEWWRGIPEPSRTDYVGHYRDIFLGRSIVEIFTDDDMGKLPTLLNLTAGIQGIPSTQALYPLTFHDQRTLEADRSVATYKNGLEFHQQQKFLLAWPGGVTVRMWGGYGWVTMDDGPPGCDEGDARCSATSVFDSGDGDGWDGCMETPVRSPLDIGLASTRRWVCEHRWAGVAGLVGYRKACRGLPVTQIWASEAASKGNMAYRAGDSCFVAIQRKRMPLWRRHGDWDLSGMHVGLPEGSYCDVGSLATRKGWTRQSCRNEVVVDAAGKITSGSVPEGDLLAIHIGDRLAAADADVSAISNAPRTTTSLMAIVLLVFLGLRPSWQ